MQNQWISTVEELRANVAQKETFINKLLAENMALLEACRAAKRTITIACYMRSPNANGGAGLATPDEQVTLAILHTAIIGATSEPQTDPPAVVLGCGTGSERF